MIVQMIYKRSPYKMLGDSKRVPSFFRGIKKEDVFEGFTLNPKVAQVYIDIHIDKDLYVKETTMSDVEYDTLFNSCNLKEIQCFKLENGNELIVIRRDERIKLLGKGVFYDSLK